MLRSVVWFVLAALALIAVAAIAVKKEFSLKPIDGEVVTSVWKDGELVFRAVLPRRDSPDPLAGTSQM